MATTGAAAVAETHCAVVVLVGDRASKLKKPVDLGFLDFRSAAARHAACLREVELNRRLAPDVYLGVAEVRGPDDASDWLVVMRRMPAEARLWTLVRSGVDVEGPLRALARQLAAFHSTARHDERTAAEGTRDAVRARWRASFDQTRPRRGAVLDAAETAEVERLALRYLARRDALLASRIADGLVRDGHGDLLADDVFVLPDGLRALDCDAVTVAEGTFADLVELRCAAPAAVTEARLRARVGTGDPSDADAAVAARLRADFAPWPSAVTVDTSDGEESSLVAALAAVRDAGVVVKAAAAAPYGGR